MASSKIEYLGVPNKLFDEEQKNGDGEHTPKYFKHYFAKRYFVAIMTFLGFMSTSPLRANLAIAIVDMTSNKTIVTGNQTIFQEAEFDWTSKTKALIFSMSSYGPFLSLLSGYLVHKIGGSTSFGIAVFALSVLSISVPAVLQTSFILFLAVEFVEGFLGDFLHCSCPEIWAKWAPPSERSKLLSISYSGLILGIVISFPFCGFLVHHWGWQSGFYVTGTIALAWAVIWSLCITDEPSKDHWILKKEALNFKIELKRKITRKNDYSWKRILLSLPVWMLFLSSFTYAMGFILIMVYFPMYMKDMTTKNIQEIGLLSALPNAANVILFPTIGFLMDYVQNRNILTPTQVHKLFTCIGFTGGGLLLILSATTPSFTVSLICLILFRIIMLFASISVKLLPVYISPHFPSIIQSFASYGFSTGSIIGTTSVGFIVTQHSSYEWSVCFTIFGLVSIGSAFIFLLFASADEQSLSHPVDRRSSIPLVERETKDQTLD